jgi:hypothetical protein
MARLHESSAIGSHAVRYVPMLLVICGAGASYDSASRLPPPTPGNVERHWEERPPLANQLFDDNRTIFREAMDQFKDCKALVPFLRNSASVEKELAKVREQAKTFPLAGRELAAIQYYLHFALWDCQRKWAGLHGGITNYVTLVREIERWRHKFRQEVCFVTFNYDTMLEEAVSEVLRIAMDSLDAYIAHPYYSLIKLHGSVNWGRELDDIPSPRGDVPQSLIDRVATLSFTERYRLVSRYPMAEERGHLVFPALAIPVENKDEFSCPATHVERLRRLLPSVTRIITVGWRATEADFLDMLKLTKGPDIMIVSGSTEGVDETYANLVRVIGRSSRCSVDKGFSGLIGDLDQMEDFLR